MTQTSDSANGSGDHRAEQAAPASPTRTVLRLVLLLVAVAAGLWLLFSLQGVILLLLLSMLFAYLIAPLVEFLCRPVTWGRRPWAIPRPLAIAMVYLALFASVGIASYVLLPLLGAQVTEFGRQVPSYMAYARDHCRPGSTSSIPIIFLKAFARPSIERLLARSTQWGILWSRLRRHAPPTGLSAVVILIPVVAFFLLKDGAAFRRTILLTLPRGRLRGRGAEVFEDINDALAAHTCAPQCWPVSSSACCARSDSC